MNFLVVLEGEKASKNIYKNWIPLVNPNLSSVNYLNEIKENNFYILAGYGQPRINERIKSAISDANENQFINRLVVSLDSEEKTYFDKYQEVSDYIDKFPCRVETRIIIQHFCIETWLLGNRTIFRKNPQNNLLLEFYNYFEIRNQNPELLPTNPKYSWNKSQFAYNYLRTGIQDIYSNRKSYSKSNSSIAAQQAYFSQVKERYLRDKHIMSFSNFINAFTC